MQFAAGADLSSPPPDPPSGAPTNLGFYLYGSKWTYTWTSFDISYQTDVSFDSGDTIQRTLGANVEEYDSGSTTFQNGFAVRHRNGGSFSDWVLLFE